MDGRYTTRLEEKQATSMEVIEGQKTLDGRDRQIEVANDAAAAAQATADAALDRANRAHAFAYPVAGYPPDTFGTGNSNLVFAYETARKAHIRSSSAALGNPAVDAAHTTAEDAYKLGQKALYLDRAHASPENNEGNWWMWWTWTRAEAGVDAAAAAAKDAAQAYNVGNHKHPYASDNHSHGEYAPKNHHHTGTTGSAAGPGNHKHSFSFTPFINYPAEARRAMLSLRTQIREIAHYAGSEHIRTLAGAVEMLCKLHMDYVRLDAYEREERLQDSTLDEWNAHYRRVYGLGEHTERDRHVYMHYGSVRMDPYEGIASVEGSDQDD